MILDVSYRTGSGNTMPITIHSKLMDRSDIPVMPNDARENMCQKGIGCKGKNGGCPPFAPEFWQLKPSMNKIYTVVVELDMAGPLTYAGWWKGVSAPGYYIIVYADRLSMNYSQRLLKYFEALGHYTVGLSNCPGCRPKDCTILTGGKCKKPKKRRYSMEATGVYCDKLHRDFFGEVLPWWFHEPEHMPAGMFRYAGILTNESEAIMDGLLSAFVTGDSSYVVAKPPDLWERYADVILEVPADKADAGMPYAAYRIPIELMGK